MKILVLRSTVGITTTKDFSPIPIILNKMKFLVLFCVLSVALAAPQSSDDERDAKILRDDRVHSEGGAYSFDFETDNGIKVSEGGQPEGDAQAISSAGEYSFTLPNGEVFSLKYVANENGFQPDSAFLPQAPAFPHPIPDFVLDQIAFAQKQREEEERA